MTANTRKGCAVLFLVGALLLAACEPATPTPVAQVSSSATEAPATSTLSPYPVVISTPAASPAPSAYPAAPTSAAQIPRTPPHTPTPWPIRTPLPSSPTPTPIIFAAPVITTAYLAPLGNEKTACSSGNVELWQDLLAFNKRSYRRPLADIPGDELARIGQTLFPNGLPLRYRRYKPDPVPAVVNVLDAARYDLDGDGQAENIYALHVPRFVPDPNANYPYYWDGPMSLAILSADNRTVRWQSPNDLNYVGVSGEMLGRPCTFIAPYRIAPGVPGLLFYRWVRIEGTGGVGEDWVTIYAWQGGIATPVWEDMGSNGNKMGASYYYFNASHFRLVDIDADQRPEILKTTDILQESSEPGASPVYNYRFHLYLPGSLAYKWTGQGYTACYLRPRDDTAELWPLRCGITPFYASLVSSTVTLDGDLSDFGQLQYDHEDASTPAVYSFGWSGTLNALWDSDTLYLGLKVKDGSRLQLWFDTDLAGDFDSTTPNQDDVFIDVTLPQDANGTPRVTVMRPDANGQWQPDPAATARVRAVGRLELAIPLDLLGLKDALQGVRFGTVEYETDFSSTFPFAVYRPRAIRAIGFAAMLDYTFGRTDERGEGICPITNNPTTWGNLIFMAED